MHSYLRTLVLATSVLLVASGLLACSSAPTLSKVVKRDGGVVIGQIIDAQPEAIVVKDASGATQTINRTDIVSILAADDTSSQASSGGAATGGGAPSSGGATGGATSGDAPGGGGAASGGGGAAGGGAAGGGSASAGGATGTGGQPTSNGSTPGGGAAAGGGETGGAAAPTFREITIPAETALSLTLESPLASDRSRVEDRVTAHVRNAVTIGGVTALPVGAVILGSVTDVKRSGKVKGVAQLSFRFHTLKLDDQSYDIRTVPISQQARATKGEDAKKIGIGAAAGAIVGGIAGGAKGAGVGTVIGGGAGAGVTMSQRGEEVHIAEGAPLTTRLQRGVTVRILAK